MNDAVARSPAEIDYCPPRLLLQWHVTERCNLRCAHCYQEGPTGEELSFDGLREVLKQYRDLLSFWRRRPNGSSVRGQITVTGGEPFVREDFLDLLDLFAAHRREFRFAILTNGTLIDPPIAKRLRRLNPTFVQVSLDGMRATHDRIRGEGNFERTVAAIRQLRRLGIRTMVSFSAHRANFSEFPDVCRLACDLKVAKVWADRVVPCGRGASLNEALLSQSETLDFFLLMSDACREAKCRWFCPTVVSMHRALQFLAGGGPPYRCAAGDSLLAVQPNGDLYPCRRMPIRTGNLRETPLAELYYKSKTLRALRDHERASRGCQSCVFARPCGGGLKCLSYAVTGDPFVADPGCWRSSELLGEAEYRSERQKDPEVG